MKTQQLTPAWAVWAVFVLFLLSLISPASAQAAPPLTPPGLGNKAITVTLESMPDGTGVALDAVTLAAGTQQIFYAVERNKQGHFTKLATDISWQAAPGNWVVVNATASAITIEARIVGQAALNGDSAKYGPLTSQVTVTPGAPYSINIENAGDGSGSAITTLAPQRAGDLSPPLYAVVRDRFGNYVTTATDAVWSYSGPAGSFIPAGNGMQFSATKVATGGQITLAYPGLLSSTIDNITILPGAPYVAQIETAADGSGTVITQGGTLQAGQLSPVAYPVARDRFGNFVQTLTGASWSYSGPAGSFTPAGAGVQFSATRAAVSQQIRLDYPGLTGSVLGGITITPAPASAIFIENLDGGAGQALTTLPALQAGSQSQPLYATLRDPFGNFVQTVTDGTWAYSGTTGTFTQSGNAVQFSATHAASGQQITLAYPGMAGAALSGITISAGSPYAIQIENAADGSGSIVATLSPLNAGTPSATLFAVVRDQWGNYLRTASDGSWTYSDSSGSFTAAGGGMQFSATRATTSGQITLASAGLVSGIVRNITIFATTATRFSVESASDGSGTALTTLTLNGGDSQLLYAVGRDGYGNFIALRPATWTTTAPGSALSGSAGTSTKFSATTAGAYTITGTDASLGAQTVAVSVFPGNAASLKLSGPTTTSTEKCQPLTLQTLDSVGNVSAVGTATPLSFSATGSAHWFSDAACTQTMGTGFSLAAGSSSVTGYVLDTVAESSTLGASAQNLAATTLLEQFVGTGVSNSNQLAIGRDHMCAITADSGVKCWGKNDIGQLGNGTISSNRTLITSPTDVVNENGTGRLLGAQALVAGYNTTCALKTNQTISCWGGQSWVIDTSMASMFPYGPGVVPHPLPVVTSTSQTLLGDVQDLALYYDHACALVFGSVYCWGNNSNRTSGYPRDTDWWWEVPLPYRVWQTYGTAPLTGAAKVAVGVGSSCTIKLDSTVWCWGGDGFGLLGDGPDDDTLGYSAYPKQVIDSQRLPLTAKKVTIGGAHACALKENGTLWCWGYTPAYAITGGFPYQSQSSAIGPWQPEQLIDISAGATYICAVGVSGTVYCDGTDMDRVGALGVPSVSSLNYLTPVSGLPASEQFVAVKTKYSDTCAIAKSGNVYCWGGNEGGQFRTGNANPTSSPVLVFP